MKGFVRAAAWAALCGGALGAASCDDDTSDEVSRPDAAAADMGSSMGGMDGADMGDNMGGSPDAGLALDIQPEADGPYTAAYSLRTVTVGERALTVGVWGPTEAAASAHGLPDFVAPDRQDTLSELIGAAPEGCPTDSLTVALDGEISAGAWPVVLYSHCHECLGVSGATMARRLATWGHVVIAPDHADNTLWDALDDTGVAISGEFLETRGADIVGLLDAALSGEGPLGDLTARIDAESIGVAGHSYGAVTAGWVASHDARIDALYAIAAPVENPLIPGVDAEAITAPTVMLLAVEDNSITELGNRLIRQNFESIPAPAIKLEIADAGHWSVSDLCGLVEAFAPGCGEGTRQTNDEPFSYLAPATGRDLAATWGVAHFGAQLHGDAAAAQWLMSPPDQAGVEVERHP